MSELPQDLEQLKAELLALGEGAMLIGELDGFVAGVPVCPYLVMPSEWMPMWWTDSAYAAVDATAPGNVARLLFTLNVWRLANY